MKLLEKVEAIARQRRLAENTLDAYRGWIRQFLLFSARASKQWKRPEELGTADVEAFLNDLVSRRRLSASSQNQALNALVFLYAQVMDTLPQDHLGKFALLRSKRPKRVPTVLSGEGGRTGDPSHPEEHISRAAGMVARVPCPTLAWACLQFGRHAHASVGHGTLSRFRTSPSRERGF